MVWTYLDKTIDDWRSLGSRRLDEQRTRVDRLQAYYDGEPVGHTLEGRQRDIFRRLLREARANWCELIVNAVAERLAVVGFRFGDDTIEDLAWYIWQANLLDADSEMVQTDALVCGHSYVSVWPDDENPSGVSIYPEHPSEVITFHAAPERREAVAAYKSFADDFGERVEVVILPELVATWREPGGALEVEVNELGVVPYEDLVPAPRTIGSPRSELHSAIPFQDRINTVVYNRQVAADFGAFRQVTATGIHLKRTEDGGYEPPFDVGADRLLISENDAARFGVIPEATLRGYLDAEEMDVRHLAAITQTPPHYLLGQMINIPASGMKAAETGLVAKVRRRAAHLGEGWERVIRRALSYVGSAGAAEVEAEAIWRDFESRSEGETVDALLKMRALGVPLQILWERWGASPQDVKRWEDLAEVEAEAEAEAAAEQAAALAAAGAPLPPTGGGTSG